MPERVFSEGLLLPDGRKVRVLAYDDGSVRFRVDGTPYVLEEAFLSGGRQDHAIVKLTPKAAGNQSDGDADDGAAFDPLARVEEFVTATLARVDKFSEKAGPGRIKQRHERNGLKMALVLMQETARQARQEAASRDAAEDED